MYLLNEALKNTNLYAGLFDAIPITITTCSTNNEMKNKILICGRYLENICTYECQ